MSRKRRSSIRSAKSAKRVKVPHGSPKFFDKLICSPAGEMSRHTVWCIDGMLEGASPSQESVSLKIGILAYIG